MNISLITSAGTRVLPSKAVKSISALSQCNLLVTKTNGEQIQCVSAEFEK